MEKIKHISKFFTKNRLSSITKRAEEEDEDIINEKL